MEFFAIQLLFPIIQMFKSKDYSIYQQNYWK